MKQHAGDEIRQIMAAMPSALVEALQAAHAEAQITEREARWWGYLQYARTGAYDGTEFVIRVNGTGEETAERFLSYVLSVRAADARAGLVRQPWPASGFERAG